MQFLKMFSFWTHLSHFAGGWIKQPNRKFWNHAKPFFVLNGLYTSPNQGIFLDVFLAKKPDDATPSFSDSSFMLLFEWILLEWWYFQDPPCHLDNLRSVFINCGAYILQLILKSLIYSI